MSDSQQSTTESPFRFSALLSLVALVIIAIVSSRSLAERTDNVVRFKSPHRSLMVVEVRVNGLGPYPFLLDTGATSSSVDPNLSDSLHLPLARTVRIASWRDTIDARRVGVQNLSLGPVNSGPLYVLVLPLVELKSVAPGVRGVLGQDVLLRSNYLIDNRKHRIQFDGDGDLLLELGGDRIQTAFVRTRIGEMETRLISIPVQTELTAEPLQLLLDSGADVTTLQPGSVPPSSLPRGGRWMADENGRLSAASALHTRLTVGKNTFSCEAWIGGGGLKHLAIDGLLPTGAFDQIYVGNTGSFVIFDPKRMRHEKQRSVLN